MKLVRLAVIFGAVLCQPLAAKNPTPGELVDEAIARTKAMSYRSDQIDWPELEARVRASADGAVDIIDILPALETLVEGLGDGHSFVNASDEDRAEFKRRTGHEFTEGREFKRSTSPFMGRRDPSVASLELGSGAEAGLVVVPLHMGGGPGAAAYAQALYDGLASGAANRCGYIIDLRGNGGGNVWPMLAGLSPLLGDPWNSYDLKPDGTINAYATVWRGKVQIIDRSDANFGATILELERWKPLPALPFKPVAVLTDDAVGSSGEGVAVAFRGRPDTRSFGSTTYGLASSNEGFVLAERVNVVVTTGLMVDRFARTYPDGLGPDESVANPAMATGVADPVIAAAKAWLDRQPGCA